MKLHILSDLHIEFGTFEPPATDADIIILAGDIGVGTEGLAWIKSHYTDKPVIYVPGNHEFYQNDLTLTETLKQQAPPNIHVLDNDQMEIEGVRILGSVLWTDFALYGQTKQAEAMQLAQKRMSDYLHIQNNGQPLTAQDTLARHQQSRAWLQERLAEPFEGKTVVVTHHLPSPQSIPQRFIGSELAPAFVSDLDHLIQANPPALWIHGHAHNSADYTLHRTRIVCNPRGYYDFELTETFKPDLVVEI